MVVCTIDGSLFHTGVRISMFHLDFYYFAIMETIHKNVFMKIIFIFYLYNKYNLHCNDSDICSPYGCMHFIRQCS